MSHHPTLDALLHTQEYRELARARARLIWPLTLLMLFVYYAYILVIAFMPGLFALPVGAGHTTWGIVTGLGVILFTFVLTGIYVYKANARLEKLVRALHDKAETL